MFWDKAKSVFPAWGKQEQHAIDNARVAVVLVSPAALASPLMKGALPALVEAATKGRLTLTWILLEPCNWQSTFLAQYQALNDTRPLERLSETEATAELAQLADRLARLTEAAAPRPSAKRRQRGQDDAPIDVEALAATPFTADRSVANNASIAFLAEHHGKTLLVCGDASAEVLADSIRRLLPANGVRRLRVDAFVVPHNGSLGNLNRELLELLDCDRYLISSNGEVFRHPHREAVARILAFGRAEPDRPLTLVFNYRTQWTSVWDNPELKTRWNYQAIYPTVEGGGIKVRI
jgi:hypothetical protein